MNDVVGIPNQTDQPAARAGRPRAAIPILGEVRLRRPARPLTDAWERIPVAPRHATLLGISFRPPQAEALGLDPHAALQTLLSYPFHYLRLAAYWNRIEPEPGAFRTDDLDAQIAAAADAGKQIILAIGPLKNFSYPEFYVPAHHLPRPLPEGTLIRPAEHAVLLAAATAFIERIVARYRQHPSIRAWQIEHEAVDPLGVEHSWRLARDFVAAEIAALRAADASRPVLLNGFLPTSLPVRLSQWWQTRDQGDSLAVAQDLADMVGIDYYPRHALVALGNRTLYLDGGASRWQRRRLAQLRAWAHAPGHQLLVSEGQAEPWEAVTTPPNPASRGMYSCPPEQVIANYNAAMRWFLPATPLAAYLCWGAEYWLLRQQSGDPSYLAAFARLLAES